MPEHSIPSITTPAALITKAALPSTAWPRRWAPGSPRRTRSGVVTTAPSSYTPGASTAWSPGMAAASASCRLVYPQSGCAVPGAQIRSVRVARAPGGDRVGSLLPRRRGGRSRGGGAGFTERQVRSARCAAPPPVAPTLVAARSFVAAATGIAPTRSRMQRRSIRARVQECRDHQQQSGCPKASHAARSASRGADNGSTASRAGIGWPLEGRQASRQRRPTRQQPGLAEPAPA